jgi:hypothetical protein
VVTDLHALGELLAGHIRHEERTLFPLIEEAMTPDGQSALAAAIHAAEGASRGPGRDPWRGHVVALVRRRVGSAGRAAHGQLGHL